MKKAVTCCLAVLVCTPAFAQFKNPVKATKNLSNLERSVTLAQQVSPSHITSWVPSYFVPSQKVSLQTVPVPVKRTPVTASLLNRVGHFPEPVHMRALGSKFIMGGFGEHGYGKAFYEDQTELARDLHAFYEGKADTLIGPDGHKVKLYALPVDGILYKPVAYRFPVVLNSREYFVVYDTQTQTGRIAKNTPEVYNLFKPQVYDEIWSALGASKEFDDLNNLCDAILLAHLHKARIDQLRANGVTEDTKTLVNKGRSEVWKQLNNQPDVVAYLQRMPKYRHAEHGFVLYTLDLPVEGLSWIDRDGVRHEYTQEDHAMVFFEMGSVGVFPRTDLEDPNQFIPVEKTPETTPQNVFSQQVMAHPQSARWTLYNTEKESWRRDRARHAFDALWAYYPHHFDSPKELGEALHSFNRQELVRVYDKTDYRFGCVYELPVEGLMLGHNTTAIDPEAYVFLYNQETGGKLVKRADLENAALYDFVIK